MNKSETGCCPRFDPTGWDGTKFVLDERLFVRATAIHFLHIPIKIGSVITKTLAKIEAAGATPTDEYFMLSADLSPWRGEHFFAVTKNVPDSEMVRLSGNFLAKVFEDPFKDAGKWCTDLKKFVESRVQQNTNAFSSIRRAPSVPSSMARTTLSALRKFKSPQQAP